MVKCLIPLLFIIIMKCKSQVTIPSRLLFLEEVIFLAAVLAIIVYSTTLFKNVQIPRI